MTNGERILCYLPGFIGWGGLLRTASTEMGVQLEVVPPDRMGRTIASLLGLPGTTGAVNPGTPPAEPALLLFGFTRERMEQFLDGLRDAGLPGGVLKAVVTPTNLGWTFTALCAELSRERAAFQP